MATHTTSRTQRRKPSATSPTTRTGNERHRRTARSAKRQTPSIPAANGEAVVDDVNDALRRADTSIEWRIGLR